MLRRVLPLVLVFSSLSYAGQLKSVDFLYSSEPAGGISRNFLEVDLTQDGCSVVPEKERGRKIIVELKNCQINRPYVVGKRGNFVKGAKLIPKGKDSLLLVELNKPGVLKLLKKGKTVKLKILEGNFIKPEINSLRTVSGEEIVIDFPMPVNPTFEKIGNKLILVVPDVKLEPGKGHINATYVSSVSLSNSKKGGLIALNLSKKVTAVEVLPKENQIFVKLIVPNTGVAQNRKQNLSTEGPKVALHFTNADVKSVIRAIASVANVNVVFDPEVTGKVNIDFKKPVPWKEALKAVLDPLSLTYVETPDYIRILPKSKIVKEEKLEPVNEYIVPVNYVNASDLVKDITDMLGSSDREKVAVNKQTNSLLLKVTSSHYRDILRLVKEIDRPRKQVLVKAKIVQLSTKAEKDLGFTWYISGYNRIGNSSASTYTTGSYGFNTDSYTPLISPDTYMHISNIPVMNSTLALGILNRSQTLRVELALKALEVDGEAQVISSPKVLTLDNQEATIEQGIEIPYRESTVGAGGATSYSINFKKASLLLKVKPHITSDNNVLLDLELHKDSPNYDYVAITGSGEPAINTRNVKSKVLVHNGDTIVIGGIYEKEKNRSVSGVPVLSRIPLLGWLFKNSQTTVSKKQMLVFITPVIVESNGEVTK